MEQQVIQTVRNTKEITKNKPKKQKVNLASNQVKEDLAKSISNSKSKALLNESQLEKNNEYTNKASLTKSAIEEKSED